MRAARTLFCIVVLLGHCAQVTNAEEEAKPAKEEATQGDESAVPPPGEWETQWKKQWVDKWQANQVEREQQAMEPVNVERANKIAEVEDQKAEQAQMNFDLMLYGGLMIVMLGVPAAIYKLCCSSGAAPSGLSNIVTVSREEQEASFQSRGMAPPPPGGVPGGMSMRGAPPPGGGAPGAPGAHARYNTEQLRQTVARLRAQV
eukprot:gene12953-15313_t